MEGIHQMLRELRVKNFAIVEDGTLELGQSMTVFTGETGAGKSLLLDAITLLLGAKAHSDLVRSGAKCAEVEGVFDLSRDREKQELAESLGFSLESDEGYLLVVRREISSQEVSKNRIWIQGKSATRSQLQGLLGNWVEVSGQHEFLRLGRDTYILSMIDQFGGLKTEVKELGHIYRSFCEAQENLKAAEEAEASRETRLDYLKFQLEEFSKLGISESLVNDEVQWMALKGRLGNVEKIRVSLGNVKGLLESEGEGKPVSLQTSLQGVVRELRSLTAMGPDFLTLVATAEKISEFVGDFNAKLDETFNALDADPESLESAEAKLSQVNRLKRKYNTDTEGLLKIQGEAQAEFADLNQSGQRIAQLKDARDQIFNKYATLADRLHSRRTEAAAAMQTAWEKDVRLLGMAKAKFELRVESLGKPTAHGTTQISAFFSGNAGEPSKPLAKVASGGELSRIMLALKNLVAERSEIGVYLFDEVDSGIGGETAQLVGARLRSLAQDNQVLCVTHLAQIAAHGHSQFRIHKITEKGRTRTLIAELDKKERELELARMLGDTGSKAALGLAKELLKKVGDAKSKSGRGELSL